jgi:Protein of unknown function (DUF3175)
LELAGGSPEISGFAPGGSAQDRTKSRAKVDQTKGSAMAPVAARDDRERRARSQAWRRTDTKRIAASLKRSAERSSRRKAGAYRSALLMLTFYINRAGKTLPKTQRERLERAKS